MKLRNTNQNYLTSPKGQVYWRYLSLSLGIVTAFNRPSWGFHQLHPFLNFVGFLLKWFTPILVASEIIYFFRNYDKISINQICVILVFTLAGTYVLLKVNASYSSSFVKVMNRFIDEIHLYNFQKDEYSKTKLTECETYCRFVSCFLGFVVFLETIILSVLPYYNSMKNYDEIMNGTKKFELNIYLTLPLDYEYDYKNWLLVHAIDSYCIFIASFTILVIDSAIFAAIIHMTGHLDVLKHDLKMITDNFTPEPEIIEITTQNVKNLIRQYIFIRSCFNKLQFGIDKNIAINYGANMLMDSIVLFQIMTNELSAMFGYFCMMMILLGVLTMMSCIVEEYKIKSGDLPELVYALPWEYLRVSDVKNVSLLMLMTQDKMEFRGAGGMETGIKQMLFILKSSFSTYVMLKSLR